MLSEAVWVYCSCGDREGAPRPWPVLTLAHGQRFEQQHRRCRRAGPGRGAAGQHDVDDAHVRLECACGCRCFLRRLGCVVVAVVERGAPQPWPVLTRAHGQPSEQPDRRCWRAGLGRVAAGQHDADVAHVRQGMWWMSRCGCVAVAVTDRERDRERESPTTLAMLTLAHGQP
jgi:hypothetical protein